MAVRDEIVWRSGIVYIVIILVAVAIISRIAIIQFVQGNKWTEMGESYTYKTESVPGNRGDILASDGRILASSIPYYNIFMDTRSSGMDPATWTSGIDGLSAGLARIVGLEVSGKWKSDLNRALAAGDRYYLIRRTVTYAQMKQLRELPIFRNGRYKGGMIAEMENRRILPHMILASRTRIP
ncbi:MAG: hypothetical protein R2727_09300 [Bacteroidales bacterium]